MQQREKILASILVIAVGGGVIVPRVWNAYQEPMTLRTAQIRQLDKRADTASFDQLMTAAKLRKMSLWKTQSLPPNPQSAMLLYQQWLTDLCEIVIQFQNVTVSPERLVPSRDGTYVALRVKVAGDGTVEQVRNFLYVFYRTDLLQHIANLNLETRENPGKPLLAISITAEGLSVAGAPERGPSLFPRTVLNNDVDEETTMITIEDPSLFPKMPPFRVRLDGEFLNVAKATEKAWTVERAVDAFPAARHTAGTVVELAPLNVSMKDRTLADYDAIVTLNPFAKPVEVVEVKEPNHPPTLQPVAAQTTAPGQTVTFTVPASDPETPADHLSFSLTGDVPAGATIDAATGEVNWTPELTVTPGEHHLTVQVTDNDSPPATSTQQVTVNVTEDIAQYTFLTAAISADDQWQAWLYDRSSNTRLVLHEGGPFEYGGIEASVVEIRRDFVLLQIADVNWKLELGKNLRSLIKLETDEDKKKDIKENTKTEDEPESTVVDAAAMKGPMTDGVADRPAGDAKQPSTDTTEPAKPDVEETEDQKTTADDSRETGAEKTAPAEEATEDAAETKHEPPQ